MEEILASIRRIIADDQSLPGKVRTDVDVRSSEQSSPVHVLASDEAEKSMKEAGPDVENGAMQGLIAAPQFAGPEGPITDVPPPRRTDEAPTMPVAAHEPSLDVVRGPGSGEQDALSESTARTNSPVAPESAATLLSAATDNAVSSAFNVLAASRLADNSAELLGMTREMVRPLLRAWLDENLPALVERLVRDEIERVARGGR